MGVTYTTFLALSRFLAYLLRTYISAIVLPNGTGWADAYSLAFESHRSLVSLISEHHVYPNSPWLCYVDDIQSKCAFIYLLLAMIC